MRLVVVIAVAILLTPGASALTLPLDTRPGPQAPTRSDLSGPHDMGGIDDPEGDAREMNGRMATSAAARACQEFGAGSRCNALGSVPPPPPDVGATPAPPSLDILSLRFAEAADVLVVTLELARLTEGFEELFDADEHSAFWVYLDDSGRAGAVFVQLAATEDGALAMHSAYFGGAFGANWKIPVEFEYGTPGVIRWTLPRQYLGEDVQNAPLEGALAATLRQSSRWDLTFARASMSSPHASHSMRGTPGWSYSVDRTESIASMSFELAATPLDRTVTRKTFEDDASDATGPAHASAEILSMGLIENATHAGVVAKLATVSATDEVYYLAVLSLPERGILPMTGTYLQDGERTTWSGVWVQGEEGWEVQIIDTLVEIVPGAPGEVRISWPRAEMPPIVVGDLVAQTEFLAWNVPFSQVSEQIDALGVAVEASPGPWDPESAFDWAGPNAPVFVSVPPADAVPSFATLVKDVSGDTRLPRTVLDPSLEGQFDVTSVEARPIGPGMTRITLSLRELDRIRIPAGYHAVAYAAAVATPVGPHMVAYYRTEEVQQFFCAPDATVLVEDKIDPYEAIWTAIEGTVARTDGSGGSGPGAIVFRVPNTCFGQEGVAALEGSTLAGGTYLVSGKPGLPEVEVVDEVRADEPVVLGAAAATPPTPAWYECPFDTCEFWNILGVGLALVGGGVAVLARQHRRSVLQRQLAAIDEIHARERGDSVGWKRAMGERRAMAGDLLRRHKLRPDEVLVIERRIELLAADVAEPAKVLVTAAVGATLAQRYRLDRLLGEGAQGRAFLARDMTLGRDVVVKVLATNGMDARSRRALLAEARLMAMIDHPNVVRVLDVRESEEAGEVMLIMEFVEGGSLRGLLERRGHLGTREALAVARGVLAGLGAAHERGVVHRDVKPENVLLTKDGVPKLADFGAACDASRSATIVPLSTGTLDYMSPEQVRGVGVDARSDLYSTAAMLYEILSGVPYLPLRAGDEFQARAMILERAPDLALEGDAAAFAGVLLRALSKDPAARFASAAQMLAALEAAAP